MNIFFFDLSIFWYDCFILEEELQLFRADRPMLPSISNVYVMKRFLADVKLSLLHLRICSRKPLPGGCCQEACEETWDVKNMKITREKGY